MPWDDDLLDEQRGAAAHTGSPARLLAGPGTGKTLTLTRHVCFLIAEKDISPNKIQIVTFTRAAAQELRVRITNAVGAGQIPHISTLHAFALRQLIGNEAGITSLPRPLRIADDWEEHSIILEDLKSQINLPRIQDAQELLNQMSADWQSLTADESDWERRFPHPQFLGAWQEHRSIYGYTLRAELVYRFKKVLEQRGDFRLKGPIEYLMVDEYQDLNRCDLAVVQHISDKGVEVFIAGDDDQSIYGFRKAHPEGIRRFPADYPNAVNLVLEVCKRCDRQILDLGLFVAKQDTNRISKTIRTEPGQRDGNVEILRFIDQIAEAFNIASICQYLVQQEQLQPSDILILLRSDHNAVFSKQITDALTRKGIVVNESGGSVFDDKGLRALLAFMRLVINKNDSLSWRTLLKVWVKGIGTMSVEFLHGLAREQGETFAQSVMRVHRDRDLIPSRIKGRLVAAIDKVLARLQDIERHNESSEEIIGVVQYAAGLIISNAEQRADAVSKIQKILENSSVNSLAEVLRAIETAEEQAGYEGPSEDGINILTMHKAKGLTAAAVIVAAAEDEYIPGRDTGEEIDDARRLLYVSLTRAEHHLYITYCDRRTGPQMHTGRTSGSGIRRLTRFLSDSPIAPRDGAAFVQGLADSP